MAERGKQLGMGDELVWEFPFFLDRQPPPLQCSDGRYRRMTRDQVKSKHIKRLLPPGEGPISYPLEFTTIKASPEAVTIYSHTFEN